MKCETATESAERQLTRNGIEFRGRHRVCITPYRRRGVFLAPSRRSVFQHATTQKKRSARSRFVTLAQRHRDHGWIGDDNGVDGRLFDLSGQKQCYRAVVVLIIGIMMNEFMQARADCQNGSPLEHRNQKQRDDLRSCACAEIIPSARLFCFSLSVHETAPSGY